MTNQVTIHDDLKDQEENNKENNNANNKNNYNPPRTMRGKEEGLGSFVFGYGHVAQAEMYNKTIEEVADYVGKKFSKEMRLVIKKKKEFAPTKPTHPTPDKDGNFDEMEKMEFKSDYEEYKKDMKQYKELKSKVFLLIMGQCTTNLKEKIESHDDFDKMEEDYDVIKLIDLIRKLSYGETDTKYVHCLVVMEIRKLAAIRQKQHESLTNYYNRFLNLIQVIESRWGLLVPTKVAEETTNYARNKKKGLSS